MCSPLRVSFLDALHRCSFGLQRYGIQHGTLDPWKHGTHQTWQWELPELHGGRMRHSSINGGLSIAMFDFPKIGKHAYKWRTLLCQMCLLDLVGGYPS